MIDIDFMDESFSSTQVALMELVREVNEQEGRISELTRRIFALEQAAQARANL